MRKTKEFYTPFGVGLKNRDFSSEKYRYGFNGMEKDDEVKGEGNSFDFGARIYDNRLGRWLSVDKIFNKYPHQSSYSFCFNSPLTFIDNNGTDVYYFDDKKRILSITIQGGDDVFYQVVEVTNWETGAITAVYTKQVEGIDFLPTLYQFFSARNLVMDYADHLYFTGQNELRIAFADYAGQAIIAEGHSEFLDNGGYYFFGFLAFPLAEFAFLLAVESAAVVVPAVTTNVTAAIVTLDKLATIAYPYLVSTQALNFTVASAVTNSAVQYGMTGEVDATGPVSTMMPFGSGLMLDAMLDINVVEGTIETPFDGSKTLGEVTLDVVTGGMGKTANEGMSIMYQSSEGCAVKKVQEITIDATMSSGNIGLNEMVEPKK